MTMRKLGWLLFLVSIILLGRLLNHPANFAPVTAIALLTAVYLGWQYSIPVALVGMFLSDISIGFYDLRLMFAVYGSFALIGLLASRLKRSSGVLDIASASVFSSLLFFFVTNAVVWYLTPAYSKDLSGLNAAYFMGLPFLKNTLIGDLFYTAVLFGAVYLAIALKSFWLVKKQESLA